MALIPVTVLTGFLGAGKTTVLKRILSEPHGYKIAVIENEFGEENIDNEILMSGGAEEIIEMNNGCICCTIRGDLATALISLAERKAKGELQFDRVIIETTGMALPDPIAQTFFLEENVAQHYLLDAVVTVVDAHNAMHQLDHQTEAQSQVGFADCLLLSKTDLAGDDAIAPLLSRLSRINARAPVIILNDLYLPIKRILDIRGFNLNDRLDIDPAFLNDEREEAHQHDTSCEHAHHEHAHHHHHDHGECDHHPVDERHDDEISSFVFRHTEPFDPDRLNDFLGGIVAVFSRDLLRYKGVLYLAGNEHKILFQGVHELLGTDIGKPWEAHEERGSKIVFIGRKLPKDVILQGLEQSLAIRKGNSIIPEIA
jgi:G3E family GTPase